MEDIRDKWVDIENSGKVVNYTIVRYNDGHLPRETPFVLAMIQLEGADTPMVHILEGIDFDKVEIGMEVKAVFADETTNTILDINHFEPMK